VLKTLKGPKKTGQQYLGIMDSEAKLVEGQTVLAFLLTRKQSAFSWVSKLQIDFYAMASSAAISSLVEISSNQYAPLSKASIKSFTKDAKKSESLSLEQIEAGVKASRDLRPWELEDLQKSFTPTTTIARAVKSPPSTRKQPPTTEQGEIAVID
jgi:hypothetical protein